MGGKDRHHPIHPHPFANPLGRFWAKPSPSESPDFHLRFFARSGGRGLQRGAVWAPGGAHGRTPGGRGEPPPLPPPAARRMARIVWRDPVDTSHGYTGMPLGCLWVRRTKSKQRKSESQLDGGALCAQHSQCILYRWTTPQCSPQVRNHGALSMVRSGLMKYHH